MLSDALKGKAPLRRVFWVYGVGVSVGYSALGLFVDPLNVKSIVLYTVIGLAIGVVQCVMLWRCAPNSRSRLATSLTRLGVILGLLTIPLFLYLLYVYPAAMIP